MRVALGIDQLRINAELVARPPDAPFEHIAHTKLAANLLGVCPLVLKGERGIARDHERAPDARQIGREILGDPVREILLLTVVAEVREGQHDNRQTRRSGGLGDCRNWWDAQCRKVGYAFRTQRIDPHWPSNVLDALLPQVLERIGQLVSDLVAHHPRDADAAGFR